MPFLWLASYPYPCLRLLERPGGSTRRLRYLPERPWFRERCADLGVPFHETHKFVQSSPVEVVALLEVAPGCLWAPKKGPQF